MPRVYYNEIDPFAAAWLRELMKAGQIPDGEVDTRSIVDVQPSDLRGFVACHFFAGIGGWAHALALAGWPADREVWTGSCPCQPFSSAGAQAGGSDPHDLWPAWYRLIRECRPATVIGEQVEAAIGHGWLDRLCDDLEGEGYAVGAVGLPAACAGAFHIRQRLWFVADAAGSRWESRPTKRCERNQEVIAMSTARGILGDSSGTRLEGLTRHGRDGNEPGRERANTIGSTAAASASRAVGNTDESGWQARHGESIRTESRSERSANSSFWSTALWLPCRDGKSRPVEPGIQPLVARLPGELVPSGDPSVAYANASAEGRVGRLRGYGNSVVPQVAQAFIEAYVETTA